MSSIDVPEGVASLFMGNEAIARGALEAGVSVVTGYPGTPSSEIVEALSRVTTRNMYVEWSVNEKVALEVAAAASFAGLKSLCVMKQNGVNVASDFLLHLAISGTRGGLILVSCDDPGAFSSMNEGDSRFFARGLEIPLLEPSSFQQAKDMTAWAFGLSEELQSVVMLRSVTRLSHGNGRVVAGPLSDMKVRASFEHDGSFADGDTGPVTCAPVVYKHERQQEKIRKAQTLFEECPFNTYTGPQSCDLLIITGSVCSLYSKEAVSELGLTARVGVLTLGTTWPLPVKVIKEYLSRTSSILVVEEVLPFLEEQIKVLAADMAPSVGVKTFYGKGDGTIPSVGELTPDIVIEALSKIFHMHHNALPEEYARKAGKLLKMAPHREVTFCPGCPHRASFWSIKTVLTDSNKKGFVCGDIGCYTMDVFSKSGSLKTIHSMGSGLGIASGFGKLSQFGMDQPVLAVCGDSTFFHAAIPALINAVHTESHIVLVVLDNLSTAMTGFQPHPGLPVDASGGRVPAIDIAGVCKAIGAPVESADPFNLPETQRILKKMIQEKGTRVLILRQNCALVSGRKNNYKMVVDSEYCQGKVGGCNRLCTHMFCCPGLVWDPTTKTAKIDEVLCKVCGVCEHICPVGAIRKVVSC
ncbi:MAG: 4Fe-4S binding protein [Theionarchaea archaeon]|nr:4Fe-4S binding protein [Theionarchaea archaeon]